MASSSKEPASCSEDSVSLVIAGVEGMTLGQDTVFKHAEDDNEEKVHAEEDKKEKVHAKEDRPSAGVEGMTLGQGTVFKVMSMNVGKNRRYEGNEKGNAQQRREKVSDLLVKKEPDIVFLQESSSPTELGKILKEPWKVWEGVIDSSKSYTCIIYNEYKIEVEEHDFRTIHLNLVDEKEISDKGQFLTRLFVRGCTSKDGGSLDLLVASYHGRQNRKGGEGGLTDEEKKNIFSELLILLDEVCNKAECKVLVGGGFNLKYAIAKEVVQERSNQYNLYTKGSQDKPMDDMVDYFMYNGPPGDVSNVRVGDAIDLFDHKSLYADFNQSKK